MVEGAEQHPDNIVAPQEANQDGDTNSGEGLDEHPSEILQVLEERLYWPPLFILLLLDVLGTWFVGIGNHDGWESRESSGLGLGRVGDGAFGLSRGSGRLFGLG